MTLPWYPWGRWAAYTLAPLTAVGLIHLWRRMKSAAWDARLIVGLTSAGGLSVAACAAYCMAWWDRPHPPYLWQPDCSLVCWRYCSTHVEAWGVNAVLVGLGMGVAGALMRGRWFRSGLILCIATGVLTIPVGFLGLYAACLAWRSHRGRGPGDPL